MFSKRYTNLVLNWIMAIQGFVFDGALICAQIFASYKPSFRIWNCVVLTLEPSLFIDHPEFYKNANISKPKVFTISLYVDIVAVCPLWIDVFKYMCPTILLKSIHVACASLKRLYGQIHNDF